VGRGIARSPALRRIVGGGWDYAQRGRCRRWPGWRRVDVLGYLALPVGSLFSSSAIIGNLLDPAAQTGNA
jgi:hypothetical protein